MFGIRFRPPASEHLNPSRINNLTCKEESNLRSIPKSPKFGKDIGNPESQGKLSGQVFETEADTAQDSSVAISVMIVFFKQLLGNLSDLAIRWLEVGIKKPL